MQILAEIAERALYMSSMLHEATPTNYAHVPVHTYFYDLLSLYSSAFVRGSHGAGVH